SFEVREPAGAMHQSDRAAPLLTLIQFGFGGDRLFVRIDADRPLVDVLAGGREVSLKFLVPDGVRFSVAHTLGRLTGGFWDRAAGRPDWVERGAGGATVAVGSVLELAIPLGDLGVGSGATVAFFVAIYQ